MVRGREVVEDEPLRPGADLVILAARRTSTLMSAKRSFPPAWQGN